KESPARSTNNRTPALIAGAIGAGGILTGGYFGLRAISKHNQSDDACTTNPCSDVSQGLNNDAKTAAEISTGSFACGLVGRGVGAYLWFFTGGNPSKSARSIRLIPLGNGSLGFAKAF